jgi:5-methyltetrahydrofolate--homocysteine methyltransferase
VNSISGEEAYLDRRLGIASCYGAMFILLPMTGTSLPRTVDERRRVAAGVMRRAAGYGLKKEDLVVDALTMAVSADPMAAVETLNTIRWCSRVLGCSSVVGLSNVSFGLPERRWINAAFLAMAGALGLSSAIANPESQEVMNVKYALDVLRGADRNARQYISRFGPGGPPPAERPEDLGGTPGSRIARAVIEGERDAIAAIVEDALDKGADPRALVDEVMIPAIREVGELYERRVYFSSPQLIASAGGHETCGSRGGALLVAQGPALSKGTVFARGRTGATFTTSTEHRGADVGYIGLRGGSGQYYPPRHSPGDAREVCAHRGPPRSPRSYHTMASMRRPSGT